MDSRYLSPLLGPRAATAAALVLLALPAFAVMPAVPAQTPQPVPKKKGFFREIKDVSLQPLAPAEQAVPVDFIGNTAYTPEQLREPLADSLREIKANSLTPPRADDAAYFLSVYYRKQGYPEAEVKWDIRGTRLVLTIKEGVRTFLDKVTFAGNVEQTDATLYEYMVGGTQERKGGKVAEVPFVEADAQTGVARVRGLYESEGRLDAVVDEAVITYSQDHRRANLLVKIKEGPKYTFAPFRFEGTTLFPREKLVEALGEKQESPYQTQRVNTMQKNLEYYYKLQGYYAAEVAAQGDPSKATPAKGSLRSVPVVFTVKPGPLYRFDGVTINQLDRLRPSFIQHRFQKLHGRVYSPPELDEQYREILRTGLFRNLRLKTTPLPTSNEVRIDLEGEEAKAKEIGFSLGFSTYEGALFGLRLADRDFMGNGRPLSLNIDYTSRSIRSELLYVDPWWLESDFALRARIFLQSRTEIGYTKQEEGFRADVTRKITKKIEFGAFVSLKNVSITDSTIEPQFLGPTSYQIATLGITQSFDFRDSPTNPTKGLIINTGFDVDAIAGEVAFARATGRITYFIPFWEKFVLALGARAGAILPFTEVPIDERFFNGGGSTVRSFRERRLGPFDKGGNPIGGEFYTVFNAEVEIPIKDALFGAVFIDAGNVVASEKEASFNDMRYAIGIGARYKLPIGPVRLDLALNPTPKINESWGAVQFSFGFAF